jgi:hypothetical protein
MKRIFLSALALFLLGAAANASGTCNRPKFISKMTLSDSVADMRNIADVRRNFSSLKKLCVSEIAFREGKFNWHMLLVSNPNRPGGPFWFLPHDNEQSAFDAAVYATLKYGGGFLAVISGDNRYFNGQDPNRNFGDTPYTAMRCAGQKYPAPLYSKVIFAIINTYRAPGMPYLALHNNTNGGGISILKSSRSVHSYPAYRRIVDGGGLRDEDSLIYIAGRREKPPRKKLDTLLKRGLNVRYETVDESNNDCSMSNYVVLRKKTDSYYNIEVQHGDLKTQKRMIDILMSILR